MPLSRAILLFCCLVMTVTGQRAYSENAPKPLLGVYYFPGWYRNVGDASSSGQSGEWRQAIAKAASPRPLCGFYNDADPRLWDYYIKWMKSSGINFIAFDWYHNAGQDFLYESLDRGFLGNKSNSDISFALHWCNHGGPWWSKPLDQSQKALLEMTDTACARYFYRDNYLKIDGKPVFIIYDPNALPGFGGFEAARAGLQAMRERARRNGFKGLYLVAVYARGIASDISHLKELGFDAFCAYTYSYWHGPEIRYDSRTHPYGNVVDHIAGNVHPFLARIGKELDLPYWPTAFSGWDDRPRAGLEAALVLTDNSPEQFARMLDSAVKHVNPASPVVMVEAWNEWGEGANIEPSKQYGFGYLRQIARAMGAKKQDERAPSAEEIASWSVLSPEELKVARENESKPWPTKAPIYCEPAKSYDAAPVKMPVVISFASESPVELSAGDVEITLRDAAGVTLKTTGSDPKLAVRTSEIPSGQIKRITLEVEPVPGQLMPSSIEVFFATGLWPEFSQFCSAVFPPPKDGRTSLKVSEIMAWEKFGTPIKAIRIDPGSRIGNGCKLKRVILSDK